MLMESLMKCTAAIFVALSIAACSTGAVEPRAIPSQAQSLSNAPVTISRPDFLGKWDVVSFEGYEPVRMHGTTRAAFADFDDHGVQLRIECNTSRSSGATSVLNGRLVRGQGGRMQTEMGCGKEREERDERYFSFFDRSPTVERLPDGRLRLDSGTSVLILERPEKRRLAFVLDRSKLGGKWRMIKLTQYGQHGGYSGIGLSDVPGRIVIDGNRLSYDRCPQYDLTFSYSSDGRLMKTAGPTISNPKCPELNYPDYEAPALPSAKEILPLLHSNPRVEDVGDGRFLVANEHFGLLLTKAPGR